MASQGSKPHFCLSRLPWPRRAFTTPRRKASGSCRCSRVLFKKEGAGKAGCALHPRSRVQRVVKKAHTSIQVQRRQSGLPCAMVLRLIARSPWRSGFLVTIAREACSANLTPASRRQDHTTSPSASGAPVLRTLRGHRIQPRVRDGRDTPLEWGGRGGLLRLICFFGKSEYFCKRGWTRLPANNPTGKSPGRFVHASPHSNRVELSMAE